MADNLTPPDPPDVIAARYATAAKDAVTAIAKVGMDAFDKVNGDPTAQPPIPPSQYKPADAVNSLTQLAGAALSGGVSLARVALQVQWDRRVLLVADNVASIVGTGLTDVLDVAGDVAKKSNSRSVKKQQQAWVDAAIRLTNIGVLRGTEILETVVAGPGPYLDPLLRRTFAIPLGDNPATLAITEMIRTADGVDVSSLVAFDPANGALPAQQGEFTLVINTAGTASGLYQGSVTATDTAPPHAVRTVQVTLLLPETSDPPEP